MSSLLGQRLTHYIATLSSLRDLTLLLPFARHQQSLSIPSSARPCTSVLSLPLLVFLPLSLL